ncbi:hypothetical protein GCM10022259_19320 [Aquimarina mytili]
MILISCSNDDSSTEVIESLNSEEAELTAKVDNTTEVISDTFLQVYEAEESMAKSPIHPFLPECVVVTIEITGNSKTILVDFGTEGCEVRGRIIKGKVQMAYEAVIDTELLVINYSLEDFFIDDIQLEGNKTVTRQKANEAGNPQYTMNMDLIVTFADGTKATRTGNKTREWIEGSFNGNWGDNVFLITGAWETNFVNGNTHSTNITTPLRREASCRFLVSGIVDLVRTNYSGSLDYGDGACDNKAVFTNANGEEIEIRL